MTFIVHLFFWIYYTKLRLPLFVLSLTFSREILSFNESKKVSTCGVNANICRSFTFTVMKKRSRESISPPFPDSKRPSNASGIKCYSKDSVKKPKPNMVNYILPLIPIFVLFLFFIL